MPTRRLLHLDMDAFFAAIEQRDDRALRGKPVIVGGTPEGRGVVAAASYEARKFGIHSAMPTARAVRLCPQAVLLRGDRQKYSRVSGQVMAILRRHADLIEQISIDEAFLDVTDRVGAGDFDQAERLARQIKREIRDELQLTASVGVAPNKFLAKLGSDLRKPDGLVVIRPEEAEAFLAPLPVGKLWGVGPKTEQRLRAANLNTIGDVRCATIEQLRHLLGAWGAVAYELSRAIDDRPVVPERETKSVSAEETFPRDLFEIGEMRPVLAALSQEVARRLKEEELRARSITLKVRFGDFRTITRQVTLSEATDRAEMIREMTFHLLDEVDRGGRGIRLLGVRGAALERGAKQLSLFDPQRQKRAELARAIEYLKRRFGEDVVVRAKEVGK